MLQRRVKAVDKMVDRSKLISHMILLLAHSTADSNNDCLTFILARSLLILSTSGLSDLFPLFELHLNGKKAGMLFS